MKRYSHFSLIMMLLFSLSLACGAEATPQRVGSVNEEQETAPQEEAKEEPKEEVPEQEEAEEEPAPEPTSTPEPEPTPEPQTNFQVGDIVSIGDSVLTVLGWENIEPNDFIKPESGNKFIAVELLIVNQDDSPASISSMLQTELKDADARRYQVDLMAAGVTDSGGIDGELAPGERIRGKVPFQVPEGAKSLQFGFDANIFGAQKITINLPDEPVTMEPPAEIAGEMQQQAFAIGDIVEIGTISLIVNGIKEIPGNDFAKPEEGKKFLVVDVTVENKSDKTEAISTLLQMSLKDSSGQKYDIDLMAQTASGGTSVDGELAAGEKVRGDVGFQVPADATGLHFEFDASVFGSGKALVALQ